MRLKHFAPVLSQPQQQMTARMLGGLCNNGVGRDWRAREIVTVNMKLALTGSGCVVLLNTASSLQLQSFHNDSPRNIR